MNRNFLLGVGAIVLTTVLVIIGAMKLFDVAPGPDTAPGLPGARDWRGGTAVSRRQ